MTVDHPIDDELDAVARALDEAWEHFQAVRAEAGRLGMLVDIEVPWGLAKLSVIKPSAAE